MLHGKRITSVVGVWDWRYRSPPWGLGAIAGSGLLPGGSCTPRVVECDSYCGSFLRLEEEKDQQTGHHNKMKKNSLSSAGCWTTCRSLKHHQHQHQHSQATPQAI